MISITPSEVFGVLAVSPMERAAGLDMINNVLLHGCCKPNSAGIGGKFVLSFTDYLRDKN